MSVPIPALAIAGTCALSFGAAFAAGTMTRDHAAAGRGPATAPPARASVATLGRAAGLPVLRVSPKPRHVVAQKRPQPSSRPAPKPATQPVLLAQRPASRPSRTPQAPTQSAPPAARRPVQSKPTPRRPAPKPTTASAHAVAFFDDGE
jgi:hypothetical protein